MFGVLSLAQKMDKSRGEENKGGEKVYKIWAKPLNMVTLTAQIFFGNTLN